MKLRNFLLLTASLVVLGTAGAQVPGILNYQGRVSVKSVNFTGTGRFKFVLVDGTTLSPGQTPLTLWNNDGIGAGGNEPLTAVELPVSSGLYSVTLGDKSLKNMAAAIPASVFQNPDVRLRVWFDDGVNGSQLMMPDVRIAAVGYAFAAENANTAEKATAVANGVITAASLKTAGDPPAVGQVLTYTDKGFRWADGGVGGGLGLPLNKGFSDPASILGLSNDSGDGLFGETSAIGKSGVFGRNDVEINFGQPAGQGVFGYGSHVAVGVLGVSGGNDGISGRTDAVNRSGVYGYSERTGSVGLKGESVKGDGVVGHTSSAGKSGVVGFASLPDNNAVAAINGAGTGMFAQTGGADATAGFFWNTAGGDALRTTGNAAIGGNLTATGDLIANGAGNQQAYLGGDGNGDVEFGSKNPAVTLAAFYNPASGQLLDALGRDASFRMLTVRGGADLAEPFAMADNDELPKGTVVVIDERSPGQLKQSAHAYDTGVAGIISGANGIHPGISLKQEGLNDAGQPVALTGRVYCRADAAFGAIKPGDLLTTSATPGHAMKVSDHDRAQGAVLGKAMSALTEGKGYVLVLVTLQ